MGTTDEIQKLIDERLEKEPKKKLVSLLWIALSIIVLMGSTIAGIWYSNYLKHQNDTQQQLQNLGSGQATISKNQVELYKFMVEESKKNEKAHDRIILDQSEFRQIQGIVRKTLPAIDKKATDQIQMIFDQWRKDQDAKDQKAIGESFMQPLGPDLSVNNDMAMQVQDTIKKNSISCGE
jgi:hypothetical protein